MHHSDNHSYMGFALGMLAGSVIGAGVALLYAPKPGAQLRGDIADSVSSLRQAMARHIHTLADRAGAQLENAQAVIEQAVDAAEASAREAVDSAPNGMRRKQRV